MVTYDDNRTAQFILKTNRKGFSDYLTLELEGVEKLLKELTEVLEAIKKT
jgi:hypothetical protein